ncbi:MAG: sugar phosphate nucleotidyltransferase [Sandaracinaceae bacterium]
MLGMVFAAGLGTRLRPLTERLPKPMVPLFDRPLASYSLERLAVAGVTHCALNTHYLADRVPDVMQGHVPDGIEAHFVHEPELLGTGGGLKNAVMQVAERVGLAADEPIVVMNGDIFFWPDLERAIATHQRLGAIATVVLRDDPRAAQLGSLELDAEGRVRRLLGKPEDIDAGPLTTHMFTGVHVLSARAIDALPDTGCVIREGYRHWVDDPSEVVGGIVDDSPWRDLGTPEEYHRVHMDLLRGDLRWPGRPPDDEDAEIGEGAELKDVVLGRGAQVSAGVRLERVVVWPGTHVVEDASDCILAPHARVEAIS